MKVLSARFPTCGFNVTSIGHALRAVLAGLALLALAHHAHAATQSTTLVITSQSNTVITGLNISTTTGDCIQIVNSTNVVIKDSQIGPCGGRGIYMTGSNGVGIYDNYIHVENLASSCCDTRDGVLVSGSSYATIQGNVIAYSESNIELTGDPDDHISIIGNFLLNPLGPYPRGQNVQAWPASGQSSNTNITVSNNYALSSTDMTKYLYAENQEDSINFGHTDGFIIQNNYVTGGHSSSGCGLIADESANSGQFLANILSNTGQCGIGISNGTNQTVNGNKILNLNPVSGAGNTALYAWNQYAAACGPVEFDNNVADERWSDGTDSGYWNGGGCEPVALAGNTLNLAAYTALYPMSSTNPPPLIPPQPYACVAASPYSTQTSATSCSGSSPPPDTQAPTIPTGLTGTAASSSQIYLSWMASTDSVGVTGYQVFQNSTKIATVAGTSYSATGLAAGTTYSYTVDAFDATGNISAQTAPVSVTTMASTSSHPPRHGSKM